MPQIQRMEKQVELANKILTALVNAWEDQYNAKVQYRIGGKDEEIHSDSNITSVPA